MRITISLEDQLAKQVRREAAARGISVSSFIASTLRAALKQHVRTPQPPFELITVRGVHPRSGIDLDRPRSLDVAEDEAEFGSHKI